MGPISNTMPIAASVKHKNELSARYKPVFMFASYSALCVVMVFHSLTQLFNQDEEQYIAAAYLAQHLRLYTDFLYLQTPIYPLILSRLFMLFSGVSPFLVARLLSAALAIGSVVVFSRLAARLADERVAVMSACLFASSPLMLLAYGSTRNDIMPIFFGLCGVWFTLHGLNAERGQSSKFIFSLFFAGLCMALAVGAKITSVFIPLSALIYVFLRAKRGLVPLVLGGAIGTIPIAFYATTGFDKFFYCNVVFHLTATPQYWIDGGRGEWFTWPNHIRAIALHFVGEPTLVLAALFIAFVAFIACLRRPVQVVGKHLLPDRLFMVVLVALAIPFVFLPSPPSRPYLQPAVPYLLLSCAALYPMAKKMLERRQMVIFVLGAVIVLALQVGRFMIEGAQHLNRSLWTPAEVHNLSLLIADHVTGGAVASLYPAIVLDAGSAIYPETATAIFFFRSGNHLASARVLELNGISPKTLPLILRAKPPAAVFVGNTTDELPLLNWALRNCYIEANLNSWQGGPYIEDFWRPRLFTRPHEPGSCQPE